MRSLLTVTRKQPLTHRNQRKPMCSNEDPALPKGNKQTFFFFKKKEATLDASDHLFSHQLEASVRRRSKC